MHTSTHLGLGLVAKRVTVQVVDVGHVDRVVKDAEVRCVKRQLACTASMKQSTCVRVKCLGLAGKRFPWALAMLVQLDDPEDACTKPAALVPPTACCSPAEAALPAVTFPCGPLGPRPTHHTQPSTRGRPAPARTGLGGAPRVAWSCKSRHVGSCSWMLRPFQLQRGCCSGGTLLRACHQTHCKQARSQPWRAP